MRISHNISGEKIFQKKKQHKTFFSRTLFSRVLFPRTLFLRKLFSRTLFFPIFANMLLFFLTCLSSALVGIVNVEPLSHPLEFIHNATDQLCCSASLLFLPLSVLSFI